MADFEKILLAIAPHGKATIRAGFAAALPDCITRADLSSKLRLAHFLAQTVHESDGLATTTEYASGKAYEGRKDLGNVQKGDGVRFRGRGLVQLTGRANYAKFGNALGLDLVGNPMSAAEFPTAALTAAEYWRSRSLNSPADRDDINGVTKGVNGGLNGLASRKAYLAKAKHALSDLKGALIAGAAVETKAAKVKTTAAVGFASVAPVTAAPGVASPDAVNAALGAPGEWALIAIAVIALGAAIYFALNIRKHQDAAAALSAAAKEV